MKPEENATDLIKRLGHKSLDVLDETISIWKLKLEHAKEDDHERGIRICLRTIDYWENIKEIVKRQLVTVY